MVLMYTGLLFSIQELEKTLALYHGKLAPRVKIRLWLIVMITAVGSRLETWKNILNTSESTQH